MLTQQKRFHFTTVVGARLPFLSSRACYGATLNIAYCISFKYKYSPLIVVLHCYRTILANTCRNTHFSQCNLVSRLHVLRSVRNLHHRIALLRAEEDVHNVDLLQIRGIGDIGCQSPQIWPHTWPNHVWILKSAACDQMSAGQWLNVSMGRL